LVGKPERKIPFGRRRRRLQDAVEVCIKEIILEIVDWTDVQDRGAIGYRVRVNMAMILLVS
jgi:hypothetical protein